MYNKQRQDEHGNEIVYNIDDFDWYKARLDVESKQRYKHYWVPESFPARVKSEPYYNNYGPDEYTHYFSYKKAIKCECCGHVITTEWGDFEE